MFKGTKSDEGTLCLFQRRCDGITITSFEDSKVLVPDESKVVKHGR